MGRVRRAVARWLVEPLQRELEPWVRRWVEQAAPEADPGDRIAKLEKKLTMAMGAVQASTAQLMSLKAALEEARSESRKAAQAATSAQATAESAADGLLALEERLTALEAKRRPKKPAPRATTKAKG